MAKGKSSREPIGNTGDIQARIKLALAQSEKQFGVGTVSILGAGVRAIPLSRMDSGSHYLNDLLGGGYPEGRIIEVYGPESSGKCVVPLTKVLTPNGYKTVEQIFDECGLEMFTVTKDVPMKYALINKDGVVEHTTHFTYNGRRKVNKITTRTGLEINATHKHPLLTMNEHGYMTWKESGDIKAGDYLVTRRGDMIGGDLPETISEEEAYLLGMLVADGYFGEARIGFTNDDDYLKKYYAENILEYMSSEATMHSYSNNSSGSVNFHINIKEAVEEFYGKYGLQKGLAKDKSVPEVIMNSSILTQVDFIKGYFDCEGSIDNKPALEVTSASYLLLRDVQLMLKNLGIISILNKKIVKNYEHNDYWRLSISGLDFIKYVSMIGFGSSQKREALAKCKFKDGSSNHDCIPNIQNLCRSYYLSTSPDDRTSAISNVMSDLNKVECSRNNLRKIIEIQSGDPTLRSYLKSLLNESLYFDLVDGNVAGDEVPTFDFAMESTHTFIAESIINHNTTVALHAVAQAQKAYPEKMVLYVDSEHSLDTTYAQALGVDLTRLILLQADTGEDALQAIELWMEYDCISMYVLDSVAAMITRRELDGDIGDSYVGVLALLMSTTLKKIARLTHKTGTVGIFINQLREKIGVMFGNRLEII